MSEFGEQIHSFCFAKQLILLNKKRGKEHGARARERVERQKQKGQVCKKYYKKRKKNILLGCSDYNQYLCGDIQKQDTKLCFVIRTK
ncbi:MAG: hypothetical protein IKM76_05370 [Prevotella sp.]|nr:hypothetical protein [Prevotella sp.]